MNKEQSNAALEAASPGYLIKKSANGESAPSSCSARRTFEGDSECKLKTDLNFPSL